MTKTCAKCGETKPINQFHKARSNKDGHHNKCKDCRNHEISEHRRKPEIAARVQERMRAYRLATKDDNRYKDRYKGRYNSSDYRETAQKWHDRNPLAKNAYKLIHIAIRSGEIPKASDCVCARCGNKADDYHHHNGYDVGHELDVIPLCQSCHRIVHSELA